MSLRIKYLATAFKFKTTYLTMNLPERKMLIEEMLSFLTSVGDAEGAEWFNNQKIIHDAPEDQFRKTELLFPPVWEAFYARMLTSFHLRHAVETFLEHS